MTCSPVQTNQLLVGLSTHHAVVSYVCCLSNRKFPRKPVSCSVCCFYLFADHHIPSCFNLQNQYPHSDGVSHFDVVDVETDYHLYSNKHHFRGMFTLFFVPLESYTNAPPLSCTGLSEAHSSDFAKEHRVYRTLRFSHEDEHYTVALRHNTRLFGPSYHVLGMDFDPDATEHMCHYHGNIMKSDGYSHFLPTHPTTQYNATDDDNPQQ